MRRFAHCLILLLAPCQAAWADDAFNQSQRGACVYSDTTATRPAPAAARSVASESSAVPARGSRSNEAGGGGGGNEDDLIQRMRAPRWHSFLPGMFR